MADYNLLDDLALDTSSQSILTELAKKADLTETQPVSMTTVPLPTGAATGAKQLADNHQVSVSNQPTGFATSAKQLADGHAVSINNFPTEYPLPTAQVTTLTPPAPISGYALDATILALIDALTPLKRLAAFMSTQATKDGADRQRVNVEVMPTTNVTLTSNVVSVSGITAYGGVDPRYQFIDTARIAYNGIRQQITFTA